MKKKVCRVCNRSRSEGEFGPRKRSIDGLKSLCRECESAYQRGHYRRNLERSRKVKAEHMARARRDPEKREKILKSQKASYARKGHATQRARVKKMQTEQPFRWRCYRISRLNPAIKAADLERLWNEQRGLCALTGRPMTIETADVDHRMPRSRGGQTELANLRWTLSRANEAKGNMTDEEFLVMCKQVVARLGG